MAPGLRIRLSVMMFLEFFLWASWYVPLGGYANDVLHLSGNQVGWLFATTAIAAMISPLFVGFVADRLFSTERVLGTLHLIGAVFLFLAARQTQFAGLMTCLVINALCFMPTLALANSLAFRNLDDREKFSRIMVFATIGWILSGWIVGFFLEKTNAIFYLAAAGGLTMAVFCFTALPHTPPKGKEAGGDVLGLGALKMLKDRTFLVFAVCAFLISIPLSFYFTWGNAFLNETDSWKPTALQTLCQFSEVVVMLVMPWFIGKIGLKNVLLIGMAAWSVRYLAFGSLSFPLVLVGLLVHGFCYCFVFIASFIFADKKAPAGMSASAQSFIAFIIWGVGMFVGTQLAGYTANRYPPTSIPATVQASGAEPIARKAPLPNWSTEDEKAEKVAQLPRAFGSRDEKRIPIELVEKYAQPALVIRDERTKEDTTFARQDLVAAFKAADGDRDGAVTFEEWRKAQAHDWPPIWLWPAGLAALVFLIFALGGREAAPKPEPEEAAASKA